ncbi:MAG: DUF262 domain-containing protein [Hyphomicrobium zavarzinii]|uniref:GmrSD restriction endonuclease domain-containing protein n=1 Tax=Hyphomicrobium zavarzinii TaxID=48292 RepID=UPI001A5D7924|nr:DUF262 domain-containing protein [Hyphomicrobium zavarzinii]MBL8844967.1 DUF262 domain-containing protein [Hyphomicrobium zavarzinii]
MAKTKTAIAITDKKTAIRDPKPEVQRIEVLASRILDGDILLPKFQRAFVWDRTQILELLDSIMNNYPIGSVLLWLTTQRLRSEKNIAGLAIKDRALEYPVNYLLDGQQRLSSICGALFWDSQDKNSQWNVAYDLRKQQFFHANTLDDLPLHQVRINKLPDAAAFFKHVAGLDTLTSDDKLLLKERAEELFKRFKDYSIATVTLSDMPIGSVAPIFERINSTGTRLTMVDLMRAATWSEEFDLVDSIDEDILGALKDKGFGSIDRKSVLRNFSAASGRSFTADGIDDLRNCNISELKNAAQTTLDAYRRAVDFFATEMKVPNSNVIPYVNQVVVIAEFFRVCPNPTKSQRDEITRYFWKTSLTGYFSGWNTGQMAADKKMLEEFSEGIISALSTHEAMPTDEIWRVRQFRLNNAHAKLLALLLAEQGPRDLLTGQKVTLDQALAWENDKEYHHIFPKSFLKQRGVASQMANCVANFAMITSSSNKLISNSRPSEYFKKVRSELGADFSAVMASNLISDEAMVAAMQDDFDAFISARSVTLHAATRKLCGLD